jgi:hypothetical protein
MIEKGLKYKEKVLKKIEEKVAHETDGCSFMPQVNTKVKIQSFKPELQIRYNSEKDKSSENKVF